MLEENKILQQITSRFLKPDCQINKVLESDSEIIALGDAFFLAITTDSIVEEISSGLYKEPYHIGWMVVLANLSDLAAVGARPLGLVLNQSFPANLDNAIIDLVQKGIQDACDAHDTFILGGDTNESKEWNIGATAIGLIKDKTIISRKGAAVSDLIYTTGNLGSGNIFAFNHFFNDQKKTVFIPRAKLKEGAFIRKWASSCIDTSDGLFPALCNIMELNHFGIEISTPIEQIVCKEALDLSAEFQIPEWIFLAGPHGEYELVFTIKESHASDFEEEAGRSDMKFKFIGKCTPGMEISFNSGDSRYHGDPFLVANAFKKCNNDPQLYFESLLQISQKWKM